MSAQWSWNPSRNCSQHSTFPSRLCELPMMSQRDKSSSLDWKEAWAYNLLILCHFLHLAIIQDPREMKEARGEVFLCIQANSRLVVAVTSPRKRMSFASLVIIFHGFGNMTPTYKDYSPSCGVATRSQRVNFKQQVEEVFLCNQANGKVVVMFSNTQKKSHLGLEAGMGLEVHLLIKACHFLHLSFFMLALET